MAVGSVYHLATPGDATILGGADIPFSSNETLNGATHLPGTATIIVSDSGDYQIDYSINYTNAMIGGMVSVTINGAPEASTPIVLPMGEVTGTTLLNLTAGDVITLRNTFPAPLSLALAPTKGARMDITKKN
ncbi:BclA C-terminal domain-containing protein [Brevibacillus choshinensis]|uniref:BclA C-terminal domain-containing protein n=1 Tax=Brevibacillus choshinensis TaxID=54911 RepID=UPI003D1B6BC3